jgi:hypothetical protein
MGSRGVGDSAGVGVALAVGLGLGLGEADGDGDGSCAATPNGKRINNEIKDSILAHVGLDIGEVFLFS